MRVVKSGLAAGMMAGAAMLAHQAFAQAVPAPAGAAPAVRPAPPPPIYGWVPKKNPVQAYVAPNKPWWKLADVLALHKGQASWSQPIVRNKDLMADWHQLAPGAKKPEVLYADNRVAMIVWSGQVRVSIKGQEPFVASKGFEINVPLRLPFTMETVGSAPALWLEVHEAGDIPIYPDTGTSTRPADIKGVTYTRSILSGGDGVYDGANKPYLDYYKDVVGANGRAGAFIASDHMFVNNIRGKGTPTPPPTNLGHFHTNYSEFWFVMEGNVDYQIQGVPVFTASAGDVVTAEVGRWHRASFGGPVGQMATRVAINPFPRGLHNYTPESNGRQ
ncbi:cupin domain-containing protein [Sphingomonas sp. QA11]|uniref:cupin domain-containing protein n=1 Tax=Sphingomonas sp. QA11 TaxID=2950605 RepID=UPI00234B8EB1|nr:cupin domain-containing protein [Sphingomonas sp. QA11]WCM25473.1 cupin domain-containing protein [Sphingomonas sp. QA11]